MKIKLAFNLPMESRHGMTAGRVLEVLRLQEGRGGGCWVAGDAGEEVLVLRAEAGIVPADTPVTPVESLTPEVPDV